MNSTSLSLADISRTQHVKRWHIVDMLKDQSVAEHSYMVTMIAMEIMGCAGIQDVHFVTNVIMNALTHDVVEGITGDVPSPVKNKVRGYEELEKELDPVGHNFRKNATPTLARNIVKLADLMEAIHHLEKYGIRGRTRDFTLRTLNEKLRDLLCYMDEENPFIELNTTWGAVADKVQLSMHCSNLTIIEEACRG